MSGFIRRRAPKLKLELRDKLLVIFHEQEMQFKLEILILFVLHE
jgi:hypothetical protein